MRYIAFLLATLIVPFSSCGPEHFCLGEPGVNAVEGMIIVRFTDEVDTEERAHKIVEGAGLSILYFYRTPTSAGVNTPLGEECSSVWRMQDHPDVEYAMLSLILTIAH
ncbi:MAG: hypothetical protein JRJ87_17210 [Deltaproteobacteria bacterium]|nr:hypothetical protein [Deltaproteobacteria bacterium]